MWSLTMFHPKTCYFLFLQFPVTSHKWHTGKGRVVQIIDLRERWGVGRWKNTTCCFLLHKLAAEENEKWNLPLSWYAGQDLTMLLVTLCRNGRKLSFSHCIELGGNLASHKLFQATQPLPIFAQLLSLPLLMLQLRSTSVSGPEQTSLQITFV